MTCVLSRIRTVVALAAVCLVLAGRVSAAPPEVRDDASFFGPAAVSQANAGIQEIKRLYKKDLHVETFPTPPANLKDSFQKNQNKAFYDWAASQMAKSKIDGIYVLICKTPAHLEVVVDNASLKKSFLLKDRDKLRDALLGRFREKSYDKALTEATALVRERLEQNLGPVLPASPLNVVQDRASFFSPQLVGRINAEMKEFHQRFKKDLVIETFATPPADKQKLLAAASPAEKTKILANWLHERAKDSKADGIAVLICREPPRIQVEVSTGMSQKAFPTKDRDQLVELLVGHFKAKEFDKAAEAALDFVYDAVDRNLASPPAPLTLGTIEDRAALFSAAAMQRASQDIAAIAKDSRQSLTIETFPLPPPGQVKRVEAMNAEARNAFFAGWLKERTRTVKFEGIYLLICKQPGNLQIGLGDATSLTMFTPANRSELAKIMSEPFQAKQFDQGLLRGLEYINVNLAQNSGGPVTQKKPVSLPPQEAKAPIAKMPEVEPKAVTKDQNATEPVKSSTMKMAAQKAEAVSERVGFDVMWVVWGFAILGGLWLVIGILRALFGAGKAPPPPPPRESIAPIQSALPAPTSGPPPAYGSSPYPQKPYPQQSPYQTQQPYPAPQQAPPVQRGGGVLPSLLGGLFGGVAGGWMYDRFRGSGSANAGVSYSTGSHPPPSVAHTPAPQPPFGYNPPPAVGAVGYSSSGGDFGAPAPDQTGYASSGGDFGQPTPVQPDYATSGGDFGQPVAAPPDYESAGGDFAQPAPYQPDPIGAGGDFGAPEIPMDDQASVGGDFAPPPESPANDWAAPETGGGDFGGDTSGER